MKRSKFLAFVLLASIAGGSLACGTQAEHTDSHGHSEEKKPVRAAQHAPKQKPVPAFMTAEQAKNLKPTLPPDQFQGKIRAAYAAVREIPQTIAQLPCYCRCDRSAGHTSLYDCFRDEHGANCSTCMDSALLALKLEKEQRMTPEQIRETLIKQYSNY